MIRDELLRGLTEKQIEKARACKSSAELLDLAGAEGIELTKEQLAAINGGACLKTRVPEPAMCPVCMSNNTTATYWDHSEEVVDYHCNNCGHEWETKF